MLRRGYVEKQVEMLALALAAILSYRKRGDREGAMAAIRQAARKVTGLDIGLLAALTDESLLHQFSDEGGLDVGRCLAAGSLLHEQAEIVAEQGDAERAGELSVRALRLLLMAMVQEPALLKPDREERVDALLSRLDYHDLSIPDQDLLFRYHEAAGRYAAAEDVLFALRESGLPGWEHEAREFYNRLADVSEGALAAGGLSRAEVEEAWDEVRREEDAGTAP